FAETFTASRGKMPEIGNFAGHELFGGVEKKMVLQNVKGRPIDRLRFAIPPLPELAQHRARPSAELAGAGNSPDFVIVARPLHGRLFESALARLPEPFDPASFLQPFLEFLGERQEVT